MDEHIRALRKEELLVDHDGWFDEENAERVVSWLVAAENRRPVALVGAGFTLNARDRTTGGLASRAQVPLWSDLAKQLARDLGVSADRYDAPTLFEMYQEALGEAKLRDSLRDAVADTNLTPAEAHAALAMYPCEAIVTTNCLDTQLDKACIGWRRVVVDADLSASGQQRDLIYLHGHRDFSDSWVMTRSQYEDFPRSKPVIVARVRQLLAQHPWLIVGFGMTDPNFHSITRLVGLEMRGHQPLSLALMRDRPSAAERQHWRRLGFEIASPANKSDFANFLAWLLPKLVTTYSPSSTAARAYVRRGTTADAKLQRFRGVYSAPIVDREEAYRDWKAQLGDLLTAEERADAAQAAQEAHRVAFAIHTPSPKTGAGAPISHVAPTAAVPTLRDPLFDGLDVAPRFRPLASYEEVQWLSLLLGKGSSLGSELAEHFAWGLRQRLFEGADDLALEVIVLRLAKRAGWDDSSLEPLLRFTIASVRKYGRSSIEKLLEAEATTLGLSVPSEEEDHPDLPHIRHARAAFGAFMNVEFKDAADHYAKAARSAAEAGLDFEQWAYTVGQLDANARVTSLSRNPGDENERRALHEQLSAEVRRLAQLPAVEHWIRRADAQSRSVLREVVVRLQERDRFRIRGSWGRRYGGGGHSLWRTFRDLETIHAPPSLRAQYLEPLVPLLSLSDLALVLPNAKKPREWLDELLSHPVENLAKRQSRDKELVEYFLADQAALSKTDVIVRLECLRELDEVFRKDDVQAALTWLDALSLSDTRVRTAGGSQIITPAYWSAFSAAARWAEPALVCETAIKGIERLGKVGHAEDAVKALYDLPWYTWRPLDTETGKRFLEALTQLVDPTTAATPRGSIVADYALFALLRMLEAGLQADALTPHISTWRALLENVKKGKWDLFGESRRAAFLLEKTLAGTIHFPKRSTAELFTEWFPEPDAATSDEHDQRDERWVVLAETADTEAELLPQLRAEVERLIQDDKLIRHYRANPHLSYRPIVLLTEGIKLLPDLTAKAGRYLLRLLAVAPNFMSAASEVFVRAFWDERDWETLMQMVVAACGGSGAPTGDDDDPGLATRRQLAVLALFGDLQYSQLRQTAPFAWQSLQSFALGAVNDERLLIANRAAFSVVSIAKHIDDPGEAPFYAAALQRVAADPRVPVRSAVAHAGPDLAVHAQSEAVREAARQGVLVVEQDDNAQVSSLLARARAVPPKSASTDGKSNNVTSQEALSDGAA